MNDNILGTLIQLDTHYTRSINLERDADSSDVLSAYIPTSRALQTLTQMTDTFHQESYPRSWSLIGPYGSGKSSFAAFLAHLLENKNTKNSGIAQDILQRYNPVLADKINDNIQDSNAYCTVLLTGSAEPLSQRFVEALYRASVRYWDQAPVPAIVDELEQATLAILTSTDIINLLKKLKQAVHEKSGKGVLIIIDELGKFLEYEARHQGSNDIYLLQQLAETAQHGGETNILLVVLMHQAFEQYSKGLGEDFKKEWLKVQGRFETIPFLETAEQTLRVMAAAFRNQLNDAQQLTIKTDVARIVQVLDKQGGLPAGLNVDTSRRALQNQLSMILETVYHQAPLVKNELINRARVSGQANGAKNKLIAALLSKTQLEDLGFEKTKYPAEKTIYRAVFKETGIHALINREWQLTKPSDDNRYNYGPVWQGMADFLNQSTAPKALVDLYEHIEAAPYGVQKGVTSLLFIAYYLVNQRSLALYESGVFCPLITQELFEVLAKRPDLFSVEAIDFSGIRADLFNQYLATLIGKVSENSTLLDIVKPLAKFISQLPHYTLTTKSLEDRTLAVRDAFENTQSPVKLLFETLPQACGFPSGLDSDWNVHSTNDFLIELVKHLNILNKAYENLLKQIKNQVINAFKEPAELSLAELREVLKTKYFGLEKYTVDLQGLKAFILRLQNDQDTDKAWLESLAAFLGNAPADKWQQNNITNAEYRLIDFCNRLEQLTIVHSHQLKAGKNTQVTLFRVVSQQGETDKVAYLNPALREKAKTFIKEQGAFKTINKELKLAIIAELLSEVD